jgi:hypothetical protein
MDILSAGGKPIPLRVSNGNLWATRTLPDAGSYLTQYRQLEERERGW